METNFITWLTGEMDKRLWSNADLARSAGVQPSMVSMVISGQKKPGLKFCLGVAKALGYPPIKILRLAGVIPTPPSFDDPLLDELVEIAAELPREELINAREYLLFRLEQRRRAEQSSERKKPADAKGLKNPVANRRDDATG